MERYSQMKKTFRYSLVGLWVLLSTGYLTRWWLTNPNVTPRFSESFWIWLSNLYGAQNGEELADLELLVGLVMFLTIVTLSILFGWFIWSLVKKNR